jgi:K+-sensing histidine kinase KdpD
VPAILVETFVTTPAEPLPSGLNNPLGPNPFWICHDQEVEAFIASAGPNARGEASQVKVLFQIRRYGLALICCGLALAVARTVNAPASCFFLAIMLSSLYGGRGPGLFAVGLSALAYDYFFLSPRFPFYMDSSSLLRFGPFLGASLLIVGLVEVKRRAEEARRKIAAQVQRSEAYLAEAQKLS